VVAARMSSLSLGGAEEKCGSEQQASVAEHEARLRAMFEEAEMERLAEAGDGSHDADFPAPDAAAAEDLAPTRLAGPSRAAEPKEWRPSGVGSHPGERKRGSKGSD
jgi:hypothetical protein